MTTKTSVGTGDTGRMLERRRRVAEMASKGASATKIAKDIKVSRSTVMRDLKWIASHEDLIRGDSTSSSTSISSVKTPEPTGSKSRKTNGGGSHSSKSAKTSKKTPDDAGRASEKSADTDADSLVDTDAANIVEGHVDDDRTRAAQVLMDMTGTSTLSDAEKILIRQSEARSIGPGPHVVGTSDHVVRMDGGSDAKAVHTAVVDHDPRTVRSSGSIADTRDDEGDGSSDGSSDAAMDEDRQGRHDRQDRQDRQGRQQYKQYADVYDWWEHESSDLEDVIERRGSFANASNADIRAAQRDLNDLNAYRSVPKDRRWAYYRQSVQRARFQGIVMTLAATALAAVVAAILS